MCRTATSLCCRSSLSPYANESLDWRWQIFQRLDRHLLLHLGCFDDHYLGQHLYVHFLFPAVLGQTGENRIEQKSIIQSCSASGKRRLETWICHLRVVCGKIALNASLCLCHRTPLMWCLGFCKKCQLCTPTESHTHTKIHQISCDYEEIGSWIILLTLFCLNLRVWKNMFNFINRQQSYSRLAFVQPAQVLSVLSLCFSLPLFVATCGEGLKRHGWVGRRTLSIYTCTG